VGEVRGAEADSEGVGLEVVVGLVDSEAVDSEAADSAKEVGLVGLVSLVGKAADSAGEVRRADLEREAADSAVGLEASSVLTSEWSYCPRSL
jgi:hypothetical protein